MSRLFEELDYQVTEIGAVSLRRRRILSLDQDVWEVLLGEEHLMSSLFTASEVALAKLGLAALGEPPEGGWDITVGGLGLGYTAATALEHEGVGRLQVVLEGRLVFVDFIEPDAVDRTGIDSQTYSGVRLSSISNQCLEPVTVES